VTLDRRELIKGLLAGATVLATAKVTTLAEANGYSASKYNVEWNYNIDRQMWQGCCVFRDRVKGIYYNSVVEFPRELLEDTRKTKKEVMESLSKRLINQVETFVQKHKETF